MKIHTGSLQCLTEEPTPLEITNRAARGAAWLKRMVVLPRCGNANIQLAFAPVFLAPRLRNSEYQLPGGRIR